MAENINGNSYLALAMADGTKNSDVQFLSGTQAELNAYLSGGAKAGQAREGAFYLTIDTHRLYIGRRIDANTVYPIPVNEGIHEVVNATMLNNVTTANVGDFYYVDEGNILAICSKVEQQGPIRKCSWIQVNTAAHLVDSATAISVANKDTSGNIKVETTVTDTAGSSVKGDFTLKEGNNVVLEKTAGTQTIVVNAKDTTYELGTVANPTITDASPATDKQATVTLKDNNSPQGVQNLVLKPGDNMKSIVADANGNITFNAADATLEEVTVTNAPSTNTGFRVTVKTGNSEKSGDYDPTIRIGSTATDKGLGTTAGTSDAKLSAGIATLDVYTTAQTDARIEHELNDKLVAANAMTYKGVVNNNSAVPALANCAIGDTYKVGSALTTPVAKVGDLIIAYGTAETDGKISAGGAWHVVPSGDDQNILGELLTHGAQITDNGDSIIAGFAITNTDGKFVLTDSTTGTGNKVRQTTIAHATVNRVDTTGTAKTLAGTSSSTTATELTFTAVTGVTSDATGHVTSIETTSIKVVDSHNAVERSSYTITTAQASGVTTATIDNLLEDKDGNKVHGQFKVASETMKVTASGNALTMNLVWGTF